MYENNYPYPDNLQENHGTEIAGIIGMTANNYIGGVGIAPLVTLGSMEFQFFKLTVKIMKPLN